MTIVNYDEVLYSCQAILEACEIAGISPRLAIEWVDKYLRENIVIEV